MRRALLTVVLLVSAILVGPTAADAEARAYLPLVSGLSSPETAPDQQSLERGVGDLINEQRAAHGLAPLAEVVQLAEAARSHSQDMAANAFFGHAGSDGSDLATRLSAAGYAWSACGEVIGAGYSSAEEVVNGWLGSPGHRDILLGDTYRELGVGHAREPASPFGDYWTVEVALPAEP